MNPALAPAPADIPDRARVRVGKRSRKYAKASAREHSARYRDTLVAPVALVPLAVVPSTVQYPVYTGYPTYYYPPYMYVWPTA